MRYLVVLAVLAGCYGSPASVQVGVERSLHMTEGCSAVNVGRGRVLTAAHCVDDLEIGDQTSVGVLVYTSELQDFAVLYRPISAWQERVPMRSAELGEKIYVIGFPVQVAGGGQQLTVTDGVVASPDDGEHVRITAPIYFGNSGGGVWDDHGNLVGLSVAIAASPNFFGPPIPYEGAGYMVDIRHILPYL